MIKLAAQVQSELDGLDLVGRHVDGAIRIINKRAPDMAVIVHRPGDVFDDRRFDADLVTLIVDSDEFVITVAHG